MISMVICLFARGYIIKNSLCTKIACFSITFSNLPGGAKFAQAAQATQAMSMMRQSALGPLPGVEKPKD